MHDPGKEGRTPFLPTDAIALNSQPMVCKCGTCFRQMRKDSQTTNTTARPSRKERRATASTYRAGNALKPIPSSKPAPNVR